MKGTFRKISEFPGDRVTFYTFQLEHKELSEFEIFDQKTFPGHQLDLQVIYKVIEEMMYRGARKYFFRHEGPADALPRKSDMLINAHPDDYGLRMYCIRLTDSIVVLLNGDVKTELDPEHCGNVREHFRLAKRLATILDKAIINKDIQLDHPDCLVDYTLAI